MRIIKLISIISCVLSGSTAYCQGLSAGAEGITVLPGTTLSVDSLVLAPSSSLLLTATALSSTASAVSVNGYSSINKVYTFSSPVSFSGTTAIYYATPDLNSNPEPSLVVAYNNTPGGTYTLDCGSIADVVNHDVTSSSLSGAVLNNVTVVRSDIVIAGIAGGGSVCAGSTIPLADVTPGGSWSSTATAIATVGSAGVVTGIGTGVTTISYVVSNGCNTAAATTDITVNALPTASITATASICNGSGATLTFTGTANATVTYNSGGASHFVTLDVLGNATVPVTPVSTTTYYITSVASAAGCSMPVSDSAKVTVNNAPSVTGCPGSVTVNNDAGICGAIATYSAAIVSGTAPDIIYSQNSGTLFSVGVTTVTVTANNSCGTANCNFTVTVNDTQHPTITAPPAVTVNGYCIPVAATLGTPVTADNCGVASVTNDAPALFPVGVTTVHWTVMDIHGNTTTATQSVTVNPSTIVLSATTSNVTCSRGSNGSITTSVSGGTAPYTYSWSNGATSSNLAGIPAGTYSVTVTDVHGCNTSSAYTVGQPDPIGITAVITNVNCHGGFGGRISTTVTGGTPGYAYAWSNGSHFADPVLLSAGTYSVTVTDAHGCVKNAAYTVAEPAAINITATTTNVSCHGAGNGTIVTTVTGGTPGYNYTWSTGAHTSALSGLSPGIYLLVLTDAHGCPGAGLYAITQPAALAITGTVTNASCSGCSNGRINTTVSGGIAPYSYSWSNGSHLASPAGLAAGTYTVVVTDAHGCTITHTYTVTQPGKPHGKPAGESTAGIGQDQALEAISVYPNPTEGRFNVVIPETYKEANIIISDINGKTVETRMITDNNGQPIQLSLNVASGIYLVRVVTEGATFTDKLIVR